ncbi:hypothetical protein [Photobacterium damselae]|uniref:hypothetical protein n=1 Tax=Photobacterium damselae TaxID=38293 RepID=UPI001F1D36C6|nr:hypothetical protein [Photobacterium damselae]UKA04702.1 hypothetical protein IHC89_20905 [Photobacterium damselae subsp. damselae]
MKLKKLVTLMSMGLLVSGCAELHSSQYKDTKAITEHNIDNVSKLRESTVDKVIAGATMNDFFVDVNPVKIRVNDVLVLPSKYPSSVRVFSALPETEIELASRLNLDYGIKVKFSRLIVKENEQSGAEEKDSSGSQESIKNLSNGDENQGEQGGQVEPDQNADSPIQPKNVVDGMAVFGMPVSAIDPSLIKPIDYKGSIEGLMNLIAADRGLDWKYDEDTDTFVFYDLDTETFTLINNSGKTKLAFDMKTAVAGDGDQSSSNTNQASGTSSEYDNWGSIMDTVTRLTSQHGKVAGNQGQGQIVVTDTKENLSRIKKVIDAINAQSGIQVVMDVTFLKFSLSKNSSFGTNLSSLSASDIIGKAVSISGGSNTLDSKNNTGSLYNINFNKAGIGTMVHALAKYGTINYKFSDEMISMNNQLIPYQSTIDESYVSEISTEVDPDTKKEDKKATVSIRKTGVTTSWIPRVIGDRIKLTGFITMSRGIDMKKEPDLGISLPVNLSEQQPVDAIIDNGKTRIVSIKEVDESKANSSGIGSTNTLPIGGSEDTSTTREISVVIVTPYIIK